jgi:nicotinate-nucleotide pyrophosphorylase (carboxylating)
VAELKLADLLAEDVGDGDITSDLLVGEEKGQAVITAGEDCVLAGLEEAVELFRYVGMLVETDARDGRRVTKGQAVLRLSGPLRQVLRGERVALNFLMRMSGIATMTRSLVEECQKVNSTVRIAATRKTTPGFRFYEKKAVRLGGGDPHRTRLDDGILIKDNHLTVVGSVTEAVTRAKTLSFSKKVEVEVETREQAEEAARAGADIIMLDNMSVTEAQHAFEAIKRIDKRVMVEVSGGITPQNAVSYARYADVISMGYITHSARAIQFSLHITSVER